MKTLVLLLLPAWSLAQPCLYLAYDPFDYPHNVSLNSRNGGSGWESVWDVQNGNTTQPGYQIDALGGSLTYNELQVSGGFATGGYAYLTAGRKLNTSENGPFADYVTTSGNGIGDQTGASLWFSALLRKDQNNAQSVYTGLHNSNATWCDDCTTEKFALGYFEGHSDVGGQKRWTLRVGNDYYPGEIPVQIGVEAFLVAQIQFNTNHTAISFYVNTSVQNNEAPVPQYVYTSSAPMRFRSVSVYLGNSPGNGSVDELRLAATYTCVAPGANVEVNLPPVAMITASDTDGQAPFTVQFSGSDSYDPENNALSYRWNFGDSSPEATDENPVHTFNDLGNLSVRLTVRDQSGLENFTTQIITVRDANLSFPCQSSFSLVQASLCGSNTGIIRINQHPGEFALSDAGGTALPLENGNEYHNLSPGMYTYTASSDEGCTDVFPLYVPIDSTTCDGWEPLMCNMAIGTNLSGFADWVPERPLRNLMKHVRADFIVFDDPCFCWSNGNEDYIVTDANGYPTHIPQTANGANNKVRYVISSSGANLPTGHTYVLLYDGIGNLTVQGGVTVLNNAPGRIEFTVTAIENLFFAIHSSTLGNHVRNVRVLRIEDEFADLESQPFYEGFLQKIEPFNTLRFMDWGATNHNPSVAWEQRSSLDYFTYATPKGVPYEMMVKLANQLHKNVWICVPHGADSTYIAQMAALFKAQLAPQLTIYLEYSNEVWNWIFEQAHYNVQTAPSNLNYGRAMAAKAGRVFKIWHEVFGVEKTRVKRVLGLQAGFNYLNEQILSQLDPSEWDYGSPTSYIGLDHGASGQPVLNAASTAEDIIQNARNNWAAYIPFVKQDYNNVKLFGKEIVNYEGGQHFVGNVFGIGYPYQQAMYDAQYSPLIYDLYNDMLDTIRRWGSRMFGNFSLASPQESIYGSWGVLNDIDIQEPYLSTAPKYAALLDNVCADVPNDTEQPRQGKSPTLSVFPNPTPGDAVFVTFDAPNPGKARLQLYNYSGQLVESQNIILQTGEQTLEIQLYGLPETYYRLIITGDRFVQSAGFIIIR